MHCMCGMIFMKDSPKLIEFAFLLFVHLSTSSSKIQDQSWNALTLSSHQLLPICTYVHRCKCVALQLAHDYRFEDQVIKFLTRMKDSFYVVKIQVLFMDPLPFINRIYSLVIEEETNHRNLMTIEDTFILINVAYKPNFKNKCTSHNFKNSIRIDTFCHISCCTIDFLYTDMNILISVST